MNAANDTPAAPTARSNHRLFWSLQCAGWGIFFAAMFFAGLAQWPLAYTLARKTSLTVFGLLASSLMRYPYRELLRRNAAPALIAVAGVVLSAAFAGCWMAAYNFVMVALVQSRPPAAFRLFPDLTNTIYYAFVLIAWSTLYVAIPIVLEQRADRERLSRAETLANEAQLRALRLQIDPHFLFNTLNAISTLIAERKDAEANRMLARLSDFFRTTLTASKAMEVSIAAEIEFARQYLEIEKCRFGDRLHVEITVAPEAARAVVPALILQPLVENAVRHAIAVREESGSVAITASRLDGWLLLGVNDDGPGLAAASGSGSGVGLANVKNRLQHHYGDTSAMTFSRNAMGGLGVMIRVPFREAVE
jgi:two-component sensor histidine kinase